MAPIEITDLANPRLDPYRNLKQPRRGERFIVEGPRLVERLLQSPCPVESILIGDGHHERFAEWSDAADAVFVAEQSLLEQLVGFAFHRGVLACGRRPAPTTIDSLAADAASHSIYVVCPEINEPDNLGAILRNAGAFGANAILLGERCTDAYSRRAIRASMGAVFDVPIVECTDLRADLERLRSLVALRIVGAVAVADARPIHELATARRTAVLFGAEDRGLHPRFAALCDEHITIPLPGQPDSLNVAAASAVTLYALTTGPV